MTELGPLTLGTLSRQRRPQAPLPEAKRTQARSRPTDRGAAIGLLVEETVALFRQLRQVAAEVHGEGPRSGGRRNLLKELDRLGPRTVPQMARSRSVSRQHVQSHVNELASEGYVELKDNPAHKRSRLVQLTEEGRRVLAEMERREMRAFANLEVEARADEVARAAAVLREVRESFNHRGG